MRKILIVGIIAFALIASAGLVSATTFYTSIQGPGVFDIYTTMTHLDYDHFHGESDGSLTAWQTVQIGNTGSWTYDGADIDRYGDFSGGGKLSTYSEHNSKAQYSPAHSEHSAWVESDDTGYLGQNTHWDSGFGGVKDVDQWKKQRTMGMGATGEYDMGFGGHDLRHSGVLGDPDTGSWAFSFSAQGDVDADLFVDNAFATVEHGSGQWYTPDDYHTTWDFQWTGNVLGDISARGDRGVDYEGLGDFVNNFNWGNAIIW